MKGDPDSGIREIFACEIWNPEPRNLEFSSRDLGSHYQLESGIQDPLTWNRESTAWNSESKTVLDYLGKLPTYPSPKPTLTLTSHSGQNVGLGEG